VVKVVFVVLVAMVMDNSFDKLSVVVLGIPRNLLFVWLGCGGSYVFGTRTNKLGGVGVG